MVDIRRVGPEFSARLVKLWVETFEQAYEGVHDPENIAAYCSTNFTADAALAVLAGENTACCIASRNDKPVGFYIVKHHACPIELDADASELKQIYVLAGEYGSGLGKTLFEHWLDGIRTADKDWLWLSVSDINYRARAFYKKLDFKPLGSGPVFEVGADRLNSTIMARRV